MLRLKPRFELRSRTDNWGSISFVTKTILSRVVTSANRRYVGEIRARLREGLGGPKASCLLRDEKKRELPGSEKARVRQEAKMQKAAEKRPLDHEGKPPSGPNASLSCPKAPRGRDVQTHFSELWSKLTSTTWRCKKSSGFVSQIRRPPDLHRTEVIAAVQVNGSPASRRRRNCITTRGQVGRVQVR
jgi:hypothetical protein